MTQAQSIPRTPRTPRDPRQPDPRIPRQPDPGDPRLESSVPRLPRRQPRRFWSHAMLFTACVLLVNGLFGERGLTETIRARRAYAASTRDLTRLKHENDSLRDLARRLRTDPATIEDVARGELGLVRAGEILVTIHDAR